MDQAGSTTSIGSSANPSAFGESVTFTAPVSNRARKRYAQRHNRVLRWATSLGSRDAGRHWTGTLSSSSLSVGTHPITAVYGGDTNFAASTSASLSQGVDQSSSTSSLTSSTNPTVFGQAVTFTGTVAPVGPGSGIPTGTWSSGTGRPAWERDAGRQRPGDLQ